MRQRLLLIAGWAVAAVGSSLVASAAVAVAGGQVSDRPLRPLSAAEVAALPVPSEPLASGGFDPTTGDAIEATDEPVARRPAGDEGVAAAARARPAASVIRLQGGSVSFSAEDGSVFFNWATPRPGFVANVDFASADLLTVSFTATGHTSVLEAFWRDDELVVTTQEQDATG